MKHILLAFALAVGMSAVHAEEKHETKKVCIDQKDAKTGKVKQVCKTMKVHKKLDVKDAKK